MSYTSNFFSSNNYLTTLAEIFYPGKKYSFEIFRVLNKYYRLLVIADSKIITSFPFLDFHEEIDPIHWANKKINYIPKVVVKTTILDHIFSFREIKYTNGCDIAPFIDWSHFKDWNEFVQLYRHRRKNLIHDTKRRITKLNKEKGGIRYIFDDKDPDILDLCVKWKSTHYKHIGGTDIFLDTRHKEMLKQLHKKKALIISSLKAANTYIAFHIGVHYNHIFYSWIASYNRDYVLYSPGRLLLHMILQESFKRHHKRFDFLLGGEDYKWFYATHYRIIGPIGISSFWDNIRNILSFLQDISKKYIPSFYYVMKRIVISGEKIYFKFRLLKWIN